MRMVFTQYLTHDAGALLMGGVVAYPQIVHGIEYAPVYWLQAVANVRQSTGDDYAHGVIEI